MGIAFCWEKGKGYYLALPNDFSSCQLIVQQFQPFFHHPGIEKIGHNLKYDIKVLLKYGISVAAPIYDTMIAHYLINPDMRHNMDVLAETYLQYTPQSITALIGKKGKNQLSMRQVSVAQQTEYAVEDADVTFQLKEHFSQELASGGTQELFDSVELPLVPVLTAMEAEGICLDTLFLKNLSVELQSDIDVLRKRNLRASRRNFQFGFAQATRTYFIR